MQPTYDQYGDEGEPRLPVGLLIYLTLLTFVFSFQVVINLYAITDPQIISRLPQLPDIPQWGYGLQALLGALNLMWISALYFRQRLGFYGLAGTTVLMVLINIVSNYPPAVAAAPLAWTAVAFVLLHWGGRRSAWTMMR